MKNKIKLKKFLINTIWLSLCLIVLFLAINIHEQYIYNKNYNMKIAQIISQVKEEYPGINDNKLMNIINNTCTNVSLFKKYSIDLEKDSLILENDKEYKKSLLVNTLFLIVAIAILVTAFLIFNKNKDDEINEITKYIEEINRKNYKLNIDEMSEDELSILKSEIYKTTIMLKEAAENSNKEKLQLKEALSDISHQLKTPLTSILIILDNLIDDPNMENDVREDFIRDIKI